MDVTRTPAADGRHLEVAHGVCCWLLADDPRHLSLSNRGAPFAVLLPDNLITGPVPAIGQLLSGYLEQPADTIGAIAPEAMAPGGGGRPFSHSRVRGTKAFHAMPHLRWPGLVALPATRSSRRPP